MKLEFYNCVFWPDLIATLLVSLVKLYSTLCRVSQRLSIVSHCLLTCYFCHSRCGNGNVASAIARAIVSGDNSDSWSSLAHFDFSVCLLFNNTKCSRFLLLLISFAITWYSLLTTFYYFSTVFCDNNNNNSTDWLCLCTIFIIIIFLLFHVVWAAVFVSFLFPSLNLFTSILFTLAKCFSYRNSCCYCRRLTFVQLLTLRLGVNQMPNNNNTKKYRFCAIFTFFLSLMFYEVLKMSLVWAVNRNR